MHRGTLYVDPAFKLLTIRLMKLTTPSTKRKVVIPDVDPTSYLLNNEDDDEDTPPPDFSMAAGDFVGIYSNPREVGQWDAVVCCFFLDAAPSIVEYIQVIYNMLKDDGILLNFGPLLYHWSGPAMRPDDRTIQDYQSRFSYLDSRYMSSVDICWEDVREILINVGFEFLEEKVGIRSLYTADRRAMMNMAYRCIHFVARKRGPNSKPTQQKASNGGKPS